MHPLLPDVIGSLPVALASAFPGDRLPRPGRILLAGLAIFLFARVLRRALGRRLVVRP